MAIGDKQLITQQAKGGTVVEILARVDDQVVRDPRVSPNLVGPAVTSGVDRSRFETFLVRGQSLIHHLKIRPPIQGSG